MSAKVEIKQIKSLEFLNYPEHFIDMNGNVYNRGKMLKALRHSHGYLYCILQKDKRKKIHYIHRLMAMAFLGDIAGLQVNHKDCDKKNNKIENLEIVTAKENMKHASENNLLKTGAENFNNKLSEKDVIDILLSRSPSRELGRKYGVSKTTILNIRKREIFKWVSIE